MLENDRSRETAITAEMHQQRRGMKNALIALVILTICLVIAS